VFESEETRYRLVGLGFALGFSVFGFGLGFGLGLKLFEVRPLILFFRATGCWLLIQNG
jgi:hypothetical protein